MRKSFPHPIVAPVLVLFFFAAFPLLAQTDPATMDVSVSPSYSAGPFSHADITVAGEIKIASGTYDLSVLGTSYADFSGATAVIENPAGLSFTVHCFGDVRPCASGAKGVWRIEPVYDPAREVIRFAVMEFLAARPNRPFKP